MAGTCGGGQIEAKRRDYKAHVEENIGYGMENELFEYPALLLPRDYLSRARDFYLACRALPDFSPHFMPVWPQLTMFGHSIELVLKAYLLTQGYSAETLRTMFGHRLMALYRTSIERGLPHQQRSERMIDLIQKSVTNETSRYPAPETIGNAVALVPQFYDDFEDLVAAVEGAMSGRSVAYPSASE